MAGLNKTITLEFLIVGHTKFMPDSCFGLIKQRFRRTYVQCLDNIASVVKNSAKVNEVRLVGTENGDVQVPTYNWVSHYAPQFKKLPGIKKHHQFVFSDSHPGSVVCKEYCDSQGTAHKLLKTDWVTSHTDLPDIIEPSGLSIERQWYLFEKIRPFCEEAYQDICCPQPSIPRPTTPVTTPVVRPHPSPRWLSVRPSREPQPPAKRVRMCGNCGGIGHNKRTCKEPQSQ